MYRSEGNGSETSEIKPNKFNNWLSLSRFKGTTAEQSSQLAESKIVKSNRYIYERKISFTKIMYNFKRLG